MSDATDPAERIAREWYLGLGLTYEGVDFGECMVYDALQVANRLILESNAANNNNNPPL